MEVVESNYYLKVKLMKIHTQKKTFVYSAAQAAAKSTLRAALIHNQSNYRFIINVTAVAPVDTLASLQDIASIDRIIL